jgi:hypothetical protein
LIVLQGRESGNGVKPFGTLAAYVSVVSNCGNEILERDRDEISEIRVL